MVNATGAGDWAEGGAGADLLLVQGGEVEAVIAGFDPDEDQIHLLAEPHEDGTLPALMVGAEGSDALLLLDGMAVARVLGAAGLDPALVRIGPLAA